MASTSDGLDQQITSTLQQIDTNFSQAHEVASRVLTEVKTYAQHARRVHRAVKVRSCGALAWNMVSPETIRAL